MLEIFLDLQGYSFCACVAGWVKGWVTMKSKICCAKFFRSLLCKRVKFDFLLFFFMFNQFFIFVLCSSYLDLGQMQPPECLYEVFKLARGFSEKVF